MNFVYWLNNFLIKEHDLNLDNFEYWAQDELKVSYLWGNSASNFKEKISYSSVYKKWRYFYEQAGIPSHLLGTHLFRSGFYCQSLLNATLKGVDYNVNNKAKLFLDSLNKRKKKQYVLMGFFF